MDVRFHGLTTVPEQITLQHDARFSDDARQASRNFSLDDLAVVAAGDDLVPAGVRLTKVGERSMARHGASALDTDVTVHLYAFDGQDVDVAATLSAAMLMVSLGLATPEAPTIDVDASAGLR